MRVNHLLGTRRLVLEREKAVTTRWSDSELSSTNKPESS